MKKSTYVSLALGIIGILFLGLGMCMCMHTEWGLFQQGIVVGCIGLVILLIMIFIYRRMEHKEPIHISAKTLGTILLAVIGALALGSGLSLVMVFGKIVTGIVVGIMGILLLLILIPLCKGLK